MKEYRTSIYLDTRAKKKSGLYPLKLRLYSIIEKKNAIYPINIDVSVGDFEKMFNVKVKNESLSRKLLLHRNERKQLKLKIVEIENKADKVAAEIEEFTFAEFERKFFRNKSAVLSIFSHYQKTMLELRNNNQISTAINYRSALKSFERYLKQKMNNKKIETVTFYDITPKWLSGYEKFIVDDEGKSYTTVSMYLKSLMTIFNKAIADNDIKQNLYPFGKEKYQVPLTTGTKRALSKQQLRVLFNAKPRTQNQEKAKDFWFFSYACNGINIKDISLLRYENLDINENVLRYYRAKTVNTRRQKKKIEVFLNDFAKDIIEKYGNGDKNPKQLIFSIVSDKDDAAEKQRKVKLFVSFINTHLNALAKRNGFNFRISTYWARHTFASNSIRNGASMEFVSEALSHSDLSTTQRYFAGFEDETKKEFAKNLMKF